MKRYSYDINSLYSQAIDMNMDIPEVKLIPKKGYKEEWVVNVPWHLRGEVIAWCRENLGEAGNDRKYAWRTNWPVESERGSRYAIPRIFLRREADVTLFLLKWAQ